jgi:hexosaminidase
MPSKVLVWDEMADAGLPVDSTIIFWWRQDKPEQLKLALSKGYMTVLCPRLPFYFDFVQDSTHRYGRKWNKMYNSIQDVYAFDINNNYPLTPLESKHIAGIQANLWTETVSTMQRLDYLLFPRISALAETAWTAPGNKNLSDFMERLKTNIVLYKKAGLYYYNPFSPEEYPEPDNPLIIKK